MAKPKTKRKPKKTALQKRKDNVNSGYWKKKCDATWAEIIKTIDGHKCVMCGDPVRLNAHHLIDRSQLITRYELLNGISLCPLHHQFCRDISAHKSPVRFSYWLFNEYPRRARFVVDIKLEKKSAEEKKKRKFNYMEKLAELELVLEEFQDTRVKLKPRKPQREITHDKGRC